MPNLKVIFIFQLSYFTCLVHVQVFTGLPRNYIMFSSGFCLANKLMVFPVNLVCPPTSKQAVSQFYSYFQPWPSASVAGILNILASTLVQTRKKRSTLLHFSGRMLTEMSFLYFFYAYTNMLLIIVKISCCICGLY